MTRKILVIGDVIDDIIVRPAGPIRVNTDTAAEIEKTLGGSAANVASWLSNKGADVNFIGCVAETDLERNTANFSKFGVHSKLQVSKSKPTGSLIVLVDGQNRSMLTDRGANQELDFDAISNEQLEVAVVYISGYALLGKAKQSVNSLFARIRQTGALIAIDPGSTGFISDYGVETYREILLMADILFPNQEEAELLKLDSEAPLTVITRGESGARAIWRDGMALELPALPVKILDPTGAGDAFCAGFLATLVTNSNFGDLEISQVETAVMAGIKAGSEAVQLIGARPVAG